MDRIHVFANGARGAAVVQALVQAGHRVDSVVLPLGGEDALRAYGIPRGIRFTAAADVNDAQFVDRLAREDPRLFVVSGFSTILRESLFSLPERGTINLHAGRLPQYRGGSPLNWQMINGETEAGLSVLMLDSGIDTGDLLAEARIRIDPEDTIANLHDRANAAFPQLVLDVIGRLEAGTLIPRKQNEADGSYWHQRSDADGGVHPDRMSAAQVARFVKALTRPYPGAWLRRGAQRVRIFAARVSEPAVCGTAGRVVFRQGVGPFLVCADRAVLLTEYAVGGVAGGTLRHGEILPS